MTVPRHFETDELRQIGDPAYDFVPDENGMVLVSRALWEQVRADLLAAADELDLLMLEARRTVS